MSAQEPAERPSSQQPSVLELCMSQQSHHQNGIRLSFNPEITEAITLENLPYHYCAVTGNVNLAAFLYTQKVPFSKGITIANFAADGKEGTTPWKKPVTLSPVDIADMAGHRPAALVLALIGAQVPLHWTRDNHCLYPKSFKSQVKTLMKVVTTSPFFASLPGPARMLLVDTLVISLAQKTVWSPLSLQVWKEQWEQCVGDDYGEAQQMPDAQPSDVKAAADNPNMASYQFQIRARPPNGRWRSSLLLGLAVGLVAAEAAHSTGCSGPMLNAAAFCAGVTRPISTSICLGISALLRKKMQRH
ncbi:hypothetical protein WJX77_011832 [Trebouxia sp. C0004]